MERTLYLVSAVCIAALVVLSVRLVPVLRGTPDSGYFVQSLLPELFGLCVEGLLFVGVLTLVQRTTERNEIARLRGAVVAELEFLLTVMRNCLYQSKLGSLSDTKIDFSSSKSLSDTMTQLRVAAEERRIKVNTGRYPNDDFAVIARSVSDSVHTKAKVHLRRLEPLTPVVAQFDKDFLTEWLSLTDELYSLAREEGFEQARIDTWGENMPFEYYYNSVIELFRHLNALRV